MKCAEQFENEKLPSKNDESREVWREGWIGAVEGVCGSMVDNS